jgi:growth arrest-specific protein 8
MKQLRDDLELRRKLEIHEIEERKNAHINELMKKHEKAFGEIKNYYNDITHNNLDLIKSLKEDVAEMKKKEAANEKLMFEIAQENKRLSEPLTRALKEVEQLRHELANYEKVPPPPDVCDAAGQDVACKRQEQAPCAGGD